MPLVSGGWTQCDCILAKLLLNASTVWSATENFPEIQAACGQNEQPQETASGKLLPRGGGAEATPKQEGGTGGVPRQWARPPVWGHGPPGQSTPWAGVPDQCWWPHSPRGGDTPLRHLEGQGAP
ncbi:hypothetical protein HJG60_008698 [Phyllostomus discolor]|uniref:Uncharacterized protein n=1 Tax=Phyllostomus discolor TaxID=89673 RepID=A0A833Z3Y0_9CHIR|nr:hypothetical protein HJG60_008698 [Phyllostomus discolor]